MLPLTARGVGRAVAAEASPTPMRQVLPPSPTPYRLRALLLDGASLDYISPQTAEGRLPNFGRLLDGGASMHLTTISPTQPGPVWAVGVDRQAAVGQRRAIGGGLRVRRRRTRRSNCCPTCASRTRWCTSGCCEERPLHLRGPPAAAGLADPQRVRHHRRRRGVPLTNPAYPVRGYLVSDRAHLGAPTILPLEDRGLVYPPDVFADGVPGPMEALAPGAIEAGDRAQRFRGAVPASAGQFTPRDEWYRRVSRALERAVRAAGLGPALDGIDQAGHLFLRYTQPRAFGDVSDAERRRYGHVIEQQYQLLDDEIGRWLAHAGPRRRADAGGGVRDGGRVSPGKRLLARLLGEPDSAARTSARPTGFLIA